MKKPLVFIILILSICYVSVQAATNEPIQVFLNGAKLNFDVEPVVQDDFTLVQMRKICEYLNAPVSYNQETKEITITDTANNSIIMQLGNKVATINGKPLVLNTAPIAINNYTFVPLRTVSDILDISIEWHGDYNTVSLLSKNTSIITNSINLPDPNFLYSKVESYDDPGKFSYIVPGADFETNLFDLYINACKELGYETFGKKVIEDVDGIKTCYVRIYDSNIPNRVVDVCSAYGYSYENKFSLLSIIPSNAFWIYDYNTTHLVTNKEFEEVSNSFSKDHPYVGRTIWVHRSLAPDYGVSSMVVAFDPTPYVEIKVLGVAETSISSYSNASKKNIESMYISAYDKIYTCPIDTIHTYDMLRGIARVYDVNPQQYYNLNDYEWAAIQSGSIYIGMPEKIFVLIKGSPDSINSTTTSHGTRYQYVYNGSYDNEYYYFENDILTSYQL